MKMIRPLIALLAILPSSAAFASKLKIAKSFEFFATIPSNEERLDTEKFNEEKCIFGTFINADERLAQSKFAISPQELVERTKAIMRKRPLLGEAETLAEDFEFCAPVVGPLNRKQYLDALTSFKLEEAFDIDSQVYNIHVDPFDQNRVWFHVRPVAVHVGEFVGAKATGKTLFQPPQVNSFTFNEKGLVTQLTVGYVVDRRMGNTGGLGAAFGLFYGIGRPLPIPECQPFKPSWQFRLLNFVGTLSNKLKKLKGE